ncbi:MAG: TetR family transcriptional regulator, partial [Caulobacteraceae bacterium]|nr:TetR family transcriptional regulator [Caulobacteraceae bacterium]
LFIVHGVDFTTVRDIAHHGGVSTGAIFSSFEDKGELFEELVEQDRAAVLTAMSLVRARGKTIVELVSGMLAARLDYHRDQAPLLRATLGLEWMRKPTSVARTLQAAEDVRRALAGALEQAIQTGELTARIDIPLVSSLLHDISLAALTRAVLTDDDPAFIESCQRRTVEMILGCGLPSG